MSFVQTENEEQPQKHEAQQGSLGIRASGASWKKQGFESAIKIAPHPIIPPCPQVNMSKNQENFQAKSHLTVSKFQLSQAGMLSLSPKRVLCSLTFLPGHCLPGLSSITHHA